MTTIKTMIDYTVPKKTRRRDRWIFRDWKILRSRRDLWIGIRWEIRLATDAHGFLALAMWDTRFAWIGLPGIALRLRWTRPPNWMRTANLHRTATEAAIRNPYPYTPKPKTRTRPQEGP